MTVEEKISALDRTAHVKDLASWLGRTPETIIGWIKKYRLPAHRVGKSWEIEPDEFIEWWEARKVGR